ncbi:glycosyltransferase family 29-domain-containing protein, partial [Pavlovales sp. CCMP2436]
MSELPGGRSRSGVALRALLLAAGCVASGARPAETLASAVAACMNAARRLFDQDAQLRSYERPTHDGARVYAYSPVELVNNCTVGMRVNADYAVGKGIQGKAKVVVEFDVCLVRAQLASLRALPMLYWNGSKPDLHLWRSAMIRHDGASRGGKSHGMLKGYRKGSDLALDLGFGRAGPKAAWQRYGKCAVVGGAPSLTRASNGPLINSHDAVIRFNDHPAGGAYSKSAGARSTFRMFNSLYAEAPSTDPTAQVLQVCQNGKRVRGAIERAAADGHDKRHMLEPEVYRTFYEHFGSGGLTGALGVWFALAMCDEVTLFGFSSPCELGAKYTHYHSETAYMERVQVNTVKVALWTWALRCAGLVRWAPPLDGSDPDHQCAAVIAR